MNSQQPRLNVPRAAETGRSGTCGNILRAAEAGANPKPDWLERNNPRAAGGGCGCGGKTSAHTPSSALGPAPIVSFLCPAVLWPLAAAAVAALERKTASPGSRRQRLAQRRLYPVVLRRPRLQQPAEHGMSQLLGALFADRPHLHSKVIPRSSPLGLPVHDRVGHIVRHQVAAGRQQGSAHRLPEHAARLRG